MHLESTFLYVGGLLIHYISNINIINRYDYNECLNINKKIYKLQIQVDSVTDIVINLYFNAHILIYMFLPT